MQVLYKPSESREGFSQSMEGMELSKTISHLAKAIFETQSHQRDACRVSCKPQRIRYALLDTRVYCLGIRRAGRGKLRLGAFVGNEYPDVRPRWLDYGLVVVIDSCWVGIF